mgnify:FL=1
MEKYMQRPFLIKLFFNWCVINADFNILSIITERFTKNRESSNVFCIVIDCHAQLHAAAIVQIKVPDGDI